MIVDQFCIRAVPLELIKSLQIASLPPEPSLLSVQGPEELTEPLQHAPIEPDPSLQIDSQEPIPLLQFDRDLVTCAAVCKDWLYRSRSIQFKSLDFTPRHTWNRLSLLMDLLSSPHATIAPHVRQIVVPLHGNDWLIPFARIGQLHALRSVILHSLDCISLIPAKEVVPAPYYTEAFEDAYLDLGHNDRLEVLSLLGCGPVFIRHNGLAIIKRVTSRHFRQLNISMMNDKGLKYALLDHQPEFVAIDAHLQQPNFESLVIGMPRELEYWIPQHFPLTAAAGVNTTSGFKSCYAY
ncbi:hypothetical protein FIBSPDRAFT_905427 [Athelia psychrophila]|uniref:F-box domain-containing protein n=1 Tax=Athelia psychrophila TaxID=1759441 RepID=A0A167TGB8_9AGAM|nr:hypothetical protein FIBSPDRAFT_905427 [Fibularhizoctonia sp. CBS 109695]